MPDVASRRRLLLDLVTCVEAFSADGQTLEVESGLEPAHGESDEGNGGNAFPSVSGIPHTYADIIVKCHVGGPLSAARADGGAQLRWKLRGEDNRAWRGASWERTYRAGYTTEVVRLREYDGDPQTGKYSCPDGLVTPEGRIIVVAQRKVGSSPFYGAAVDVLYRDAEEDEWHVVQDVLSGGEIARNPRILRRPDGVLLLYHTDPDPSGLTSQLAAEFSTDEGETWGTLSADCAPGAIFNTTVDRLTACFANGYVTVVLGNSGGSVAWYYSIDGGASFKQITYYGVGPAERWQSLVPLLDETLLLAFVTTDYAVTGDYLRVCRVAAGLDLPDTINDYTDIAILGPNVVTDVLTFRGYDGCPYVVARDSSVTPNLFRVYRGNMDGTKWESVNGDPGMFSTDRGAAVVVPGSTSVAIVPYQGTYAVLWTNVGVGAAPLSTVHEGSLNWTVAAGAENVSVDWDWQWVWTMAAGDPNSVAEKMTRSGGGTLSYLDAPRRIYADGAGLGRPAWTTNGTHTNAERTAVASAVYRVVEGCGKYTGKCILDVTGSDGAASVHMLVRLGYGNWGLADQTGLTVAEGDFDFHSGHWEVLLGVTKATGGVAYALRVRPWNRGKGDRVWTVLAAGTHAISAGSSATGKVVFGSTQDLTSGDGYELMIGSWTLDHSARDWDSGSGDGLFESSGSDAPYVTRGQVMSFLPVPLVDGLHVSFSGDVAATKDGYVVSTRYQYAMGNQAPGERGEWRSETDGVEHYFTVDYGADGVPPVGPWDALAWWGTNFRTARVLCSNSNSFLGAAEYALDAAVLTGVATGAPSFGPLSYCRTVKVSGAGWEPNRWVGYYFRWEDGPRAGTAGTVTSSTEDTLVIDSDGTWLDSQASGSAFVVYADRMFYVRDSCVSPTRYVRLVIPAQGTPHGYYRGKGVMKGPTHRFHANWEWESNERRAAILETVESPGGQRYVYPLNEGTRRERDVEWTGVKDGDRQGLLGVWRAAGGGLRVVALIEDTEGGPDALLPCRLVGDLSSTTRALYVQQEGATSPVLAVVDVDKLTASEELK